MGTSTRKPVDLIRFVMSLLEIRWSGFQSDSRRVFHSWTICGFDLLYTVLKSINRIVSFNLSVATNPSALDSVRERLRRLVEATSPDMR